MSTTWMLAGALVGAVLSAAGVAVLLRSLIADRSAQLNTAWSRHVCGLDRGLRFARVNMTAIDVSRAQLIVSAGSLLGALATGHALWLLLLPPVWIGPKIALRRAHEHRVQQLEAQLDTWLLIVANGLKAVPSLGDVLASSLALIGGPLAEELEVALHEHRLGSPLNVAVRAMALRVESPVLTAAVTTLDVARRTGGALSETLEQAAASMREMARLQGVVRTKTAESKSQAWVISFVPVVLLAVLQKVCPDVIEVLFVTSRGHVVLVIAALLWVGAIVGAMRILQVDT